MPVALQKRWLLFYSLSGSTSPSYSSSFQLAPVIYIPLTTTAGLAANIHLQWPDRFQYRQTCWDIWIRTIVLVVGFGVILTGSLVSALSACMGCSLQDAPFRAAMQMAPSFRLTLACRTCTVNLVSPHWHFSIPIPILHFRTLSLILGFKDIFGTIIRVWYWRL